MKAILIQIIDAGNATEKNVTLVNYVTWVINEVELWVVDGLSILEETIVGYLFPTIS